MFGFGRLYSSAEDSLTLLRHIKDVPVSSSRIGPSPDLRRKAVVWASLLVEDTEPLAKSLPPPITEEC